MIWSIILLCASVAAVLLSTDSSGQVRLVEIAQGPVRGYKATDGNYYAFYNIPYATAPAGKQKFMPPLPPPTWEEPLEAIDQGVVCPQPDIVDQQVREDCLIANVLVPDTNQTNLPVLVYFHGGAYQTGYGNKNKYTHILKTEKMLWVSFNYRLGSYGFLCLGTEYAPGNSGLKDQIAALRWVKENIASFGGNPDDVTIYGQSAGAGSADLLMISKAAEGLFGKVMVDSGCNIAIWASDQDPIEKAADYATTYLNYTGSTDDIYALKELYVNTPMNLLISLKGNQPDGSFYFEPCVERDIGIEMAIDESPMKIMSDGNYRKLPLLYGFTEIESTMRTKEVDLIRSENIVNYMPHDLEFNSVEEKEEIINKIKQLYFGNTDPSLYTARDVLTFLSDYTFVQPMLRAAKIHKKNGNDQVYLHRFFYVSEDEDNVLATDFGINAAKHTAQAQAVADYTKDSTEMSLPEDYRQLKATIRNYYINFILYGNPTPVGEESLGPEWIPITDSVTRSPHMFFGNSGVEMIFDQIDKNETLLWDEIYSKHYKYPSPPPVPTTGHNSSSTSLSSIFCFMILSVVIFIR